MTWVSYDHTCEPCGKHSYSRRRDAKSLARSVHRGEGLVAYRCPHSDNYWHLGHSWRKRAVQYTAQRVLAAAQAALDTQEREV